MDNIIFCYGQFLANTIRLVLKAGTLLIFYQQCTFAEIIFEENLDFGKFSIVNNSNVSELTVTRYGQSFSSNSLRIITPGAPALLKFINYPAYTDRKSVV